MQAASTEQPLPRHAAADGARSSQRALAGVFAASLLAFIAIGAALPVLPTFVRGPLHGSNLDVGIVIGAFSVTSVFCRPLAGRVADRSGRRLVVLAGALAMTLGGALYLIAHSLPVALAARLATGAGEGALYTAGAAWVVDLVPRERHGFALGMFGLGVWGGLSLGPAVGEALRSAAGYDAVWALATVLPLLAACIASTLPSGRTGEESHRGERPGPAAGARRSRAQALFPRAARRPGSTLALANFGYAALAGFAVLDLRSRGIGGGAGVFTAFALAVFASRLFFSRLPDRFGPRAVAPAAAVIEAVGLLTIAIAGSLPVAIAGALVMGAGFSMLFPSLALTVVGETEPSRRGSALGAFTAFFDIGVGVSAPIAGAVASLAGYPSVFALAALAAVCAAALAALPLRVSTMLALDGTGAGPARSRAWR